MSAPLASALAISDVVLVVDDVPDNLSLLHDALDEAGYTVLVATSGEQALARAAQVHPHTRHHFFGFDGFGDVIDPPRLQRGHQVFGLGEAGHEDDGDVGCCGGGLEAEGHLEAIHAGHHRVEQHDVGQGLRGTL